MDTTEMTDRLKAEVAARLVAFTDYLTTPLHLTTEAATALMGTVLDGIDVAMQPDDLDPSPWPAGAPVRLTRGDASLAPGSIVRAVESDGEVHTVWVRWPGHPGDVAYSPRELERVR